MKYEEWCREYRKNEGRRPSGQIIWNAALRLDSENQERIDRLCKALDEITNFPIYPKEWVGKWKKRTEYMEGWNACARDAMKRLNDSKILKDKDWV